MSEEKKKSGRPTKKAWGDLNWDERMLRSVGDSEILRSLSIPRRLRIAATQMEGFLQGRASKSKEVIAACSNQEVFVPFFRARLFGHDVRETVGRWLVDEEWDCVCVWKFLCGRWKHRMEESCERGSDIASVWRLALMVEGWRLLDAHYLESVKSGFLFPSKKEIEVAAESWLLRRGVLLPENPNIIGKRGLRFKEIGLDWIPRMEKQLDEPKKESPPSLADGQEPVVTLHCSPAEMEELERRIREYDSEGAAEKQLEYLAGLDWPEDSEMP